MVKMLMSNTIFLSTILPLKDYFEPSYPWLAMDI